MLVVLDDDPTGSQSVHGVEVVTAFETEESEAALSANGSSCFVLTNTRGLPEAEAVELTSRIADQLFALAAKNGRPLDIVSRGDSTLRGHVLAELLAIDGARRRAVGAGYDSIIFAPAFFEAGRTTVANIQRIRINGVDVPAAETEFARDATFGFRSSDLKEFLAEKSGTGNSGGKIDPSDVESISLEDIRQGGAEAIADRLVELRGGRFVVVNAENAGDYDVVALAVAMAQHRGAALLVRAAPSFVRAVAGIEPIEPLGPREIWPAGRRPGHGLIVVGSHVSGTTAQVAVLKMHTALAEFELDAARVLEGSDGTYVRDLGIAVAQALQHQTVLVCTSRALVSGKDSVSSLAIARRVSDALAAVAQRALESAPAWVIAKGGITSHELAVTSFGIRRAMVIGQLGAGVISVLRPLVARSQAIGMPYVVFAGNVGDDSSLADIVDTLDTQ